MGGSSVWGSSSKISIASSFLTLVFRALPVVAFLPLTAFFPPCVMVDAVVIALSSWSAEMSAVDARSDAVVATVATDCTESREALEVLAALARPFFGAGYRLIKTKNGQPGSRLLCSSLEFC